MANEEGGKGFVERDGDKIIFNIGELRRAAQTGKRLLDILIEDVETAARRVGDYAESVKERAEARAIPAPPSEPKPTTTEAGTDDPAQEPTPPTA